MATIFISHHVSEFDNRFADDLLIWLGENGYRAFMARDVQQGVPAGVQWQTFLYERLSACEAVVVLCSEGSMSSRWCLAEVVVAEALGKKIFPVLIGDCEIDPVLSSRQVIDMTRPGATWEPLGRGLNVAGIIDWDATTPPYPGLLSFQEADAGVFFGRDDLVNESVEALTRTARLRTSSVVLFVGTSGSGKSSLIRAGVVPRLRQDPQQWLVVGPTTPASDPFQQLGLAFQRGFADVGRDIDWRTIGRNLAEAPDASVGGIVTTALELLALQPRQANTVVVVIDQFEETFGLDDGGAAFLEVLRLAVETDGSPVVLMVGMRSDFLGRFQNHPELVGLSFESVPVGPLPIDRVVDVIEKPATRAGLTLGDGLVERLRDDCSSGEALPLLAFTLRELYDRFGSDGKLALSEYESLGGLTGSVARVADEVVGSSELNDEQLDDLRIAFLNLVRSSEDGGWVRHTADWTSLPESVRPTLTRLVERRLLVSSTEGDRQTLAVAHEALFSAWNQLAEWLAESSETLALRDSLERRAEAWSDAGQDGSDVLVGLGLQRAEALLGSDEIALSETAKAFVAASQDAAAHATRREQRRRTRTVQVAVLVAVTTSALALVATVSFFDARNQTARAEEATDQASALALAAQAEIEAAQNPALGLALAVEATARTEPPTIQALRTLAHVRDGFDGRTTQPLWPPMNLHVGQIRGIDFSPDGTKIVSASNDLSVRVWEHGTDTTPSRLIGQDAQVLDAVFMPDGQRVVSSGSDGRVLIWDVESENIVDEFTAHESEINEVAVSADGARVATAGQDQTARLWDLASKRLLVEVVGEGQPMRGVALSPDGRYLATAGDMLRIVDLETNDVVAELPEHEDEVSSVAFSPDGARMVSVGADELVRV